MYCADSGMQKPETTSQHQLYHPPASMDSMCLCKTRWVMLSQHDLTTFQRASCDVAERFTFSVFNCLRKWSVGKRWAGHGGQLVELWCVFRLIILMQHESFSTKTQTWGCSISLKNGVLLLLVRVESLQCRYPTPESAKQPQTGTPPPPCNASLLVWYTVISFTLPCTPVFTSPPQVFGLVSTTRPLRWVHSSNRTFADRSLVVPYFWKCSTCDEVWCVDLLLWSLLVCLILLWILYTYSVKRCIPSVSLVMIWHWHFDVVLNRQLSDYFQLSVKMIYLMQSWGVGYRDPESTHLSDFMSPDFIFSNPNQCCHHML